MLDIAAMQCTLDYKASGRGKTPKTVKRCDWGYQRFTRLIPAELTAGQVVSVLLFVGVMWCVRVRGWGWWVEGGSESMHVRACVRVSEWVCMRVCVWRARERE